MGTGTSYERGVRKGAQHVPRSDFFRLLIGRRKLVRRDDNTRDVRGVYDPQTGDHFVIREDLLFETARPNRGSPAPA